MRLETALSSNTNQVEDRFEGTTVVDLRQNGRVLIPAGSRVRGVVTAVREAGRVDRKGSLSAQFRRDHHQRPPLTDPRLGDAGARERRLQG